MFQPPPAIVRYSAALAAIPDPRSSILFGRGFAALRRCGGLSFSALRPRSSPDLNFSPCAFGVLRARPSLPSFPSVQFRSNPPSSGFWSSSPWSVVQTLCLQPSALAILYPLSSVCPLRPVLRSCSEGGTPHSAFRTPHLHPPPHFPPCLVPNPLRLQLLAPLR